MIKNLKFATNQNEFFVILNRRVNDYFKSQGVSRHANAEMIIKTIFMLGLYLIPYAFIVSGMFQNPWILLLFSVLMGFGVGGIGLSIMHDANHGAYSSTPWINNTIGYAMNLIGGNAFNWKVQHNVLHHTYTNIHDADEDISPRGVLRMSPATKWKPVHRYQHLYAWVLYGMLTFVWVAFKDYNRLIRYYREGLVAKMKTNVFKEFLILTFSKSLYITYTIIIPILVLKVPAWWVLVGFMVMHYVAGFILAMIFQPAHVVDGTEYPDPDESGQMENSWAIHQLRTTTNFAQRSKIFSWYVGGLNLQVEHHLFPNICHVHYRKISGIVKKTAEEFNLPYKSYKTFSGAIVGHAKLLKVLGRRPVSVA
ncbi:MAG: acyl-CoA desaturase [Chryseolinea sp.]